MDYYIERDPETGLPLRMYWIPPGERPAPPPKPQVGTFCVRLRDGRETGPIPRDATRDEVEAAVREALGRASGEGE